MPRAAGREQSTTGGLNPSGICEISARIALHREAKDGKSLTSRSSHPTRKAPALCPAAGSVATPASRVVSTRFALAHQTQFAARRAANPDSIGIRHVNRGDTPRLALRAFVPCSPWPLRCHGAFCLP